MPRKPIEWSKCIIYKIWKDDDFYVGSTTDFTNRKRGHKCSCNSEKDKAYNFKIYQTIREKGGWIAWQMTPLEEYKECKSQIEARIREEEWRVKLNAQLNMRKAFGAETRQEYDKQYREEHRDKINERQKKYNDEHRDKMKIHYEANKEKKQLYHQEHKEEILEYQKQYHQDNKEKIHTYKNQKFKCNCGGKYTQSNKSTHEESIKHQTYLATL